MRTKELTWDDLANIYHKETGQQARICPMGSVFEWAEKQKDKFIVNEEGTLCLILNDDKPPVFIGTMRKE